tara:strand:+ start:333 stop:560 length:228 start_codon:yes stop_codon:yes gene_type:complete
MDIKIGMPEILIIFALVIYPESFTFSTIAFCAGLLGRIFSYVLNYSAEIKKTETINQSVDDLGTAFKEMFGGNKE